MPPPPAGEIGAAPRRRAPRRLLRVRIPIPPATPPARDKQITALGFGAILPGPTSKVSFCFPLNGDGARPDVPGVQVLPPAVGRRDLETRCPPLPLSCLAFVLTLLDPLLA